MEKFTGFLGVIYPLTLPPLGFLDVDDTGGGVNVTHTL